MQKASLATISVVVKKAFDNAAIAKRNKVALDIYVGILSRWPVRTGLSRANWLIGIGKPRRAIKNSTGSGDGHPKPATGAEISAASDHIKGSRKVDVKIYITNNIWYAPYVEAGSARHAPAGAVATTLASVQGLN